MKIPLRRHCVAHYADFASDSRRRVSMFKLAWKLVVSLVLLFLASHVRAIRSSLDCPLLEPVIDVLVGGDVSPKSLVLGRTLRGQA